MFKRYLFVTLMLLFVSILASCGNNKITVDFVDVSAKEIERYDRLSSVDDFEIDHDFFKDKSSHEVNGLFVFKKADSIGISVYSFVEYTDFDMEEHGLVDSDLVTFVEQTHASSYDNDKLDITWYDVEDIDDLDISFLSDKYYRAKTGTVYEGPYTLPYGAYEVGAYDNNGEMIGSTFVSNFNQKLGFRSTITYPEGRSLVQSFKFNTVEITSKDTRIEFIVPTSFAGGLSYGDDLKADDSKIIVYNDVEISIFCVHHKFTDNNDPST